MSPTPEEWTPPLVVLVGMGEGREDLTGRVLGWIAGAEVLAGGRRHLDAFPEHPGEKILMETSLDAFLHRIDEQSRNRRTAVLASGDPFYFGIGRRLVEVLGRHRLLAFPNVTTVQSLFSRLLEPWEEVSTISLHGRDDPRAAVRILEAVNRHSRVAVYTDPRRGPAWVARCLLEAGCGDRTLIIAEDLGLRSERIRRVTPQVAVTVAFSPLNLVVVCSDGSTGPDYGISENDLPLFGLPETAFCHESGMITKREVRAVVLAALQLRPNLVLWDLGAGSGSVGIEAARTANLKEVYAVEVHDRRYRDLLRNIDRLAPGRVKAVKGRALEVMEALPDPDRIFIGGSGPELERVLENAAERLRPRGRLVQTAVTLETLEAARSFWMARCFAVDVCQVQVNRGVPIGGSLRLEALNPVFVVSARKDESHPETS